jgi:hypothetical protein
VLSPSDGDAWKAPDMFDLDFEGLWQTIVHKNTLKESIFPLSGKDKMTHISREVSILLLLRS